MSLNKFRKTKGIRVIYWSKHTGDGNKSGTVSVPKLSGPEADQDALLIPDQLEGR